MANADGPRGFRVVGHQGGGNGQIVEYAVDADTATAIYHGDLMKAETDGNITVMAAASDDYIGPVVNITNASRQPIGSLAASTAGYVSIDTDPSAILECQFENGGTAVTAAALHDAADPVWTHAGAGNTAGVELSETLAGDGSAAQFRIVELVARPDNTWGHNAKVKVVALEHSRNTTPNAI